MNSSLTEQRRKWRKTVLRALTRLVVGGVFATVIAWVSLPYFVSAERLEDELRSTLRLRDGLSILSETPPRLSLWPVPSLTLSHVTIRQRDASVLLEADSVAAEFSLFDIVAGSVHFPEVELDNPRFHLNETWRDRIPSSGEDVIGMFSDFVSNVSLDPPMLARHAFGQLRVTNGSLVVPGHAGPVAIARNINAYASWPASDEPFSGSVSADIAGQQIGVEMSAPNLRRLIAGADAPLTIRFTLPGASLRADGSASLTTSGFFNGNIGFEATDARKLIQWFGRAPAGTEALRTARVQTRLSASGHILRFDQLSFALNDTSATGIMDLAFLPDLLPKITGTLAFEDFDAGDIDNILPVASQLASNGGNTELKPLAAFDLRLSARHVRIGEAVFGNVGASMLINEQHMLLDIGDSDFEGGRLTGRLSSGAQGIGRSGKLQLSIRDIDLAILGRRLGLNELWPSGTGSVDVSLTSERPFTETNRLSLSGQATISANRGQLSRMNAASLYGIKTSALPMPLAQAIQTGFEFERLDARLGIDKGTVTVEAATLANQTDRLSITGEASPENQLSLTIAATPVISQAPPSTTTINLGGTVKEPIVTARNMLP